MLKFLKPEPDPKELVRKWQATLRAEQRQLDRTIREIQFEEKKVHKSIKEAAKRGDVASAKSLAREIVQSRKAVGRLYTNKAQLISLGTSLNEQLAMMKVTGCISKSAEVMKVVNTALKAPELQKTMIEMQKEMMKAGLVDEMMNDALDSALDTDEMEEEVEAQVEKVLAEIAGETAASLPAAKKHAVPQRAEAEEAEEDEDLDELQARLNAVKAS